MNIVLVTSHFDPDTGGIVTVVREHAAALARLGHHVTVLVLGDTTGTGDETDDDGVHIVRRGDAGAGRRLGRVRHLRRTVHGLGEVWRGADIIHVHGYHTLLGPQVVRAARRTSSAAVAWNTHYHGRGHSIVARLAWPLYDRLAGRALRMADAVVAVSDHERRILAAAHPRLPGGRIVVIPNGVAAIGPRPPRPDAAPPTRFLYVGFLRGYKRVDAAIAGLAAYRATPAGRDATLTIIGTGPDRDRLQCLARQHGITQQVTWHDRVTDQELATAYREHDALLLLSDAEAYGLVVAEALAAGTPAIVQAVAALAEFQAVPGCTALPPPVTPDAVAAAMAATPPGCDIRTGQTKVITWAAVGEQLAALYTRLKARPAK